MFNQSGHPYSSFKKKLNTSQILSLIALAGLAAFILNVMPFSFVFNYPFRLLLTIVHELGHGIAAILTGGYFQNFVIFADGSGLAYTAGGWRFVVIPTGYLSVAIFGACLILAGRSQLASRRAMGLIGLAMIGFTLRYATPTLFSRQFFHGILTIVSGLAFGGMFLWLAANVSDKMTIFLLHLIAIEAGLTAFSDLGTVIRISTFSGNVVLNDATSMAQLTGIPAIFWAVVWIIIACGLLGGAIWQTWLRDVEL